MFDAVCFNSEIKLIVLDDLTFLKVLRLNGKGCKKYVNKLRVDVDIEYRCWADSCTSFILVRIPFSGNDSALNLFASLYCFESRVPH